VRHPSGKIKSSPARFGGSVGAQPISSFTPFSQLLRSVPSWDSQRRFLSKSWERVTSPKEVPLNSAFLITGGPALRPRHLQPGTSHISSARALRRGAQLLCSNPALNASRACCYLAHSRSPPRHALPLQAALAKDTAEIWEGILESASVPRIKQVTSAPG
jgi:hypothetical protein